MPTVVQLCTCHVLQGFFGNTAVVICEATSKCQVMKSALIQFQVTKSKKAKAAMSAQLCQACDVMSGKKSKTTDYAKH